MRLMIEHLAGHLARMNNNKWVKLVTEWMPLDGQKRRCRPMRRLKDDIQEKSGIKFSENSP